MKKQIRSGVWETNSSSEHTLVISNKGMGRSHLHIEDDGYVHMSLTTYYGKDEKDYKSQLEKLTYVVTWMYIYHGCDMGELLDSYMWKEFNEAFCQYVNDDAHRVPSAINEPECIGIQIDATMDDSDYEGAYDYLDHQTQPYGKYDDSNCVVPLYRMEEVMNFIFNKNLWLHTDCD